MTPPELSKWKSAKVRPRRIASWNNGPYGTVVLAVIAFALLVVAYVQPYPSNPQLRRRMRVQAAKTQIESYFATTLDAFKIFVGRYPTTAEGLRALVVKPTNDPGDRP